MRPSTRQHQHAASTSSHSRMTSYWLLTLYTNYIYMALSPVVTGIFNVEKWQDLEIGVRCHSRSLKVVPFDAHFEVALHSVRRRGSSSIGVPNFTRIAQLVQKLLTGSQNLVIRSGDPGHAHLWVVLWSIRREATSSISVPDFKQIALFLQKLLGGLKISKLGHVHQATPTLGSLYIPYAGRVRPASVYQIWRGSLSSFKSYERSPKIRKLGHVTLVTPN